MIYMLSCSYLFEIWISLQMWNKYRNPPIIQHKWNKKELLAEITRKSCDTVLLKIVLQEWWTCPPSPQCSWPPPQARLSKTTPPGNISYSYLTITNQNKQIYRYSSNAMSAEYSSIFYRMHLKRKYILVLSFHLFKY